MRGLIRAALVLAPLLSSASVLPRSEDASISDHSFALIKVEVLGSGSRAPDAWAPPSTESIEFHLDVFSSEAPCGHANITIDGQTLPVSSDGDLLTGKGPITLERKDVVLASWTFHCIKVNGQPHSQFLKFQIDVVGAKAVKNTGFSALFRQTSSTEIIRVSSDLGDPDMVAANPNPEGLLPSVGGSAPHGGLREELMELQWLLVQKHELELLIAEKKQAIANHAHRYYHDDIKDCDSLKCVLTTVAKKAKHAVHSAYGKIAGEDDFDDASRHGHHWPKLPFPGKGNSPWHGRHGDHIHGSRNGTHGGKRPHHFLPICRMPPPPLHGGPSPPGGNHGPGGRPSPPPPGHHDQDRVGHGPSGHPDHDREDSHLPHEHEHGPYHHDSNEFQPPHSFEHRPPPFHGDVPHPPHHFEDGPSPHHGNGPHGPHGPHGPPPPFIVLLILKCFVAGILCALLVLCVHRRLCSPKQKMSRKARREERRERRRIAHKNLITRILARMGGSGSDDDDASDDYEEKRMRLLSDMEDGLSTTMSEEIEQLQNAASVVDDMVSAEEERMREQDVVAAVYTPSDCVPAVSEIPISYAAPEMPSYAFSGGEQLPAYEDDESEIDSLVSDGCRYTPGSSAYTPGHSPSGSLNDILGPDTKS